MASASDRCFIAIIDDDDAVRESLLLLLESFGYAIRDYPSADSYLADDSDGIAACWSISICPA